MPFNLWISSKNIFFNQYCLCLVLQPVSLTSVKDWLSVYPRDYNNSQFFSLTWPSIFRLRKSVYQRKRRNILQKNAWIMIPTEFLPWMIAFLSISLLFIVLATFLCCILGESYNSFRAKIERQGKSSTGQKFNQVGSSWLYENEPCNLSRQENSN